MLSIGGNLWGLIVLKGLAQLQQGSDSRGIVIGSWGPWDRIIMGSDNDGLFLGKLTGQGEYDIF